MTNGRDMVISCGPSFFFLFLFQMTPKPIDCILQPLQHPNVRKITGSGTVVPDLVIFSFVLTFIFYEDSFGDEFFLKYS